MNTDFPWLSWRVTLWVMLMTLLIFLANDVKCELHDIHQVSSALRQTLSSLQQTQRVFEETAEKSRIAVEAVEAQVRMLTSQADRHHNQVMMYLATSDGAAYTVEAETPP